jgi:hypothetical protein
VPEPNGVISTTVTEAGFGSQSFAGWRSLGERDKSMNSLAYEIVWARNASLFFKEFQNDRPNWEKPGA